MQKYVLYRLLIK